MSPPSIVRKSALKRTAIASHKLLSPIHDHLRRVRAFGRKTRCIDALPVRKHLRGIRVFPAQIVPVGNVLADARRSTGLRLSPSDGPDAAGCRQADNWSIPPR